MKQDVLNQLIEALTILPGVGKKTAQRMALYLLDKNKDGAMHLAAILKSGLENIKRCSICRNLTSEEVCSLCNDAHRDSSLLCVVEQPADVLAIEATGGFRGKYFVLLGKLSPMDGISGEDIGIPRLLDIIEKNSVKEIILATSSSIEGDATAHYIKEHLEGVKISRISYGVPIGGELEFVDNNTIARAILSRVEM
ncbi:MAG: recombination mediator RecR [Gammaproteobacteria bacterium]